MSKSFGEVLQEWKKDNKYEIGEDIGFEYYDYLECPTRSQSSLTQQENGAASTAEKI